MEYNQNVATLETESALATNKVLRNTYMLLSVTLIFSAMMAGVSMMINPPMFTGLLCSLGAMAMIFFVLPKTANSSAGLGVVFAITGMLGFGLGPILNHYMGMANGGTLIMQALGTTGVVFAALSAYVLVSKKDFSFMGGFLMAGMIVAIVAMLGLFIASMFGIHMPLMGVALSAMVALLMCGFILYETSNIVNGGETNYLLATVGLYLSIYNLFTALLHLFGFMNDE